MTGATKHQPHQQEHATLAAEHARQGERGNGVWKVLTASTALAIVALLFIFGSAAG